MQRAQGIMDEGLFEAIARQCAGRPVRLWLHFMGEPLLHPGIVRMVRLAKESGVPQVGLSTNATRLDPEMAGALVGSGLDRIECTLDSIDREGFSRMRGTDLYERVSSNVLALLEAKARRGARSPVVSLQFLDVPPVREIVAAAVALWRPHLTDGDFLMAIPEHSFAGRTRRIRVGGARRPCAWLRSSMVILWSGEVVACPADFDGARIMGQVSARAVAEIWNSEAYLGLRARHEEGRWEELPLCEGCDDWRFAEGEGYVNLLGEDPR